MELSSLFIGVIGILIGYGLFYLLHKAKSVEKSVHEAISSKLNETSTNLKLAEERLKSQQELAMSFRQRAELKESELSTLLSRTATLEATLKSNSDRLRELTTTLLEQTDTNKAQQIEINTTKQKLSEYTANNAALLDKLNTQKD